MEKIDHQASALNLRGKNPVCSQYLGEDLRGKTLNSFQVPILAAPNDTFIGLSIIIILKITTASLASFPTYLLSMPFTFKLKLAYKKP